MKTELSREVWKHEAVIFLMTKVLFLAGYFQPLPGYGVAQEVEDVFNYGGRILYLSTQPLKRSFSVPKSAAKRMLLVWEQTLSGSQVAMG